MKKVIATAGLAVVSAAGAQAQYGLSPAETAKNWSVSASLRGFYDDNFTTSATPTDSFGFAVSPSAKYNMTLDTTYASLEYGYTFRYYESTGDDDQSHRVNGILSHAFSERLKLDIEDSFVVAQEPEVIEGVGALPTLRRSEGDNIRNRATVRLTAAMTEQLATELGYTNRYLNYDQQVGDTAGGTPITVNSRSALLDRVVHRIHSDLRWGVQPQTTAILGYQYAIINYTSDDPLGTVGGATVSPDARDNTGHYVYTGADQNFNEQLAGQIRVGARFSNYDDAASSDTTSPYVKANLNYNYNPGSFVRVGVLHDRNSTDVSALSGAGSPTLDQVSTTFHGSLTHRITGKISGSLIGQAQFSEFEGGGVDGRNENIYVVGLNLSYAVNEWIAAEAGYNYDKLDSDLPGRSFDRNRVYVGLRATY